MRRKQNTTIAWDILKDLKREKMFWKTAFIVAFASLVAVIRPCRRKKGKVSA